MFICLFIGLSSGHQPNEQQDVNLCVSSIAKKIWVYYCNNNRHHNDDNNKKPQFHFMQIIFVDKMGENSDRKTAQTLKRF